MSLVNTYHAYVFGTAFWYSSRAIMRIVDPPTVISWFRPPADQLLTANDLEIYTTRTDAFTLLTLAALLIVLCDAVPLPKSLVGSNLSPPATDHGRKPYARAVIILTIFHHIATGVGSFQHWVKPSHRTLAMDIGVFGNIFFTALGAAALVYGLGEETVKKHARKSK